jgi:transcription termination/antitermination protein NusA
MGLNMSELDKVLDLVGKDKGIDRGVLVSAIEEAMATVAKRTYGMTRDIEVRFNTDLGEIEMFQFMNVVEKVEDSEREISFDEARTYDEEVSVGDSIGIKMDATMLTRIAAQTAKQVIVQKVRDAEREIIFNEFQHRKGEVITGLVRRVDRGAVIVDLGRTEGYMPQKEQIPGEPYNPGDRVQAYLLDVQLTPKGPRIILSRAAPEYLVTLFTSEVPEIREGLVEIKGAAREPGVRAKVAVVSKDSDVDPVGACVGVRGSRVQNIVQELKGERIDIVPWDEDISRYVCNALAPAEIQKVIIDDESKMMEVVVSDASLSLAIGKRGQNVRLASQLTGWKLDIVSDTEMAKRTAMAQYQFMLVPGMTDTLAMSLFQSGFNSVRELLEADAEELSTVPGFSAEKAEDLLTKAKELVSSGKLDEALSSILNTKDDTGSESSGTPASAKGDSGIEAKLRAELAAHDSKQDTKKEPSEGAE